MLAALMMECNNFFESGYVERRFVISGGTLTPNGAFASGQYVAVTGSTFNSGVYRLVGGTLEGYTSDETFDGRVWALNVPPDFVKLAEDVAEYEKTRPSSAIASESFGGYSRSMTQGKSGVLTWQEAFAQRLAPYRRMYTEVRL